jgi:hypothetical protein
MRYIICIFLGGFAVVASPSGQTFFAEAWGQSRVFLVKVWPVVQDKINAMIG